MERLTAIEKIGIIGGHVKLVFNKEKKKRPFCNHTIVILRSCGHKVQGQT
jgi:hypothetical protein